MNSYELLTGTVIQAGGNEEDGATITVEVSKDQLSRFRQNLIYQPVTLMRGGGAILTELCRRIEVLETAIRKTLADNSHLADGDDCTLIDIKRVIEEK